MRAITFSGIVMQKEDYRESGDAYIQADIKLLNGSLLREINFPPIYWDSIKVGEGVAITVDFHPDEPWMQKVRSSVPAPTTFLQVDIGSPERPFASGDLINALGEVCRYFAGKRGMARNEAEIKDCLRHVDHHLGDIINEIEA